jgi:hypothetical protein
MWRFVLGAVLGLMVGATGPADAGVIYQYFYEGTSSCFVSLGCAVVGSFEVDSDHIAASGDTDISSFITDLSFVMSVSIGPPPPPETNFNAATGFVPSGVTVTPTGQLLLTGSGLFQGPGDRPASLSLHVDQSGSYFLVIGMDGELGHGEWTSIGAGAVPEPATWALVTVGALMLLIYTRRQRARLPKIAQTV